MTGNNHYVKKTKSIVVQPRDRHLLKELGTMRVIDREQAKKAAGFRSTSRINARLLALVRAGLLRRFFTGTISGGRKAIYTLSAKGASLVEASRGGIQRPSGETLAGDRFLGHQLHINAVYLKVRCDSIPVSGLRFVRWVSFTEPLSKTAAIIPDGYFVMESVKGTRAMFVEVDLGTESLKRWRVKIEAYLRLALSGEFQRLFGEARFRVLVIVSSERRLQSIRTQVVEFTDKIFWFAIFSWINQEGLWAAVWLRPHSQTRQPLL